MALLCGIFLVLMDLLVVPMCLISTGIMTTMLVCLNSCEMYRVLFGCMHGKKIRAGVSS